MDGECPALRVLVFSRCYPPGFRGGGPVRSLVNLVQALHGQIAFRIVTLDRDVEGGPPYATVEAGGWQQREGAEVLYLRRADASIGRLVREIRTATPHVVYLNSSFDPIFTLRVLLARRGGCFSAVPIVLAPQGELSTGALGLKPAKKRAFIRLARLCGLYRGLTWQASSVMERDDILRVMPVDQPDQIRVAADLVDDVLAAPMPRVEPATPGALRLCFLSRITPKKNLDFALEVLADVTIPVEFTIYGPIDDAAYWAVCQRLITQLPGHIRATFAGEVNPLDVRRALAANDLCVLPTRGENFGHVIYESLSAGVPVLISDQTPWSDVDARGVGWSLPLHSKRAWVQAIEEAGRRLPAERDAFAHRSLAYASTCVDRPAAARRAYALFRDLVPQ